MKTQNIVIIGVAACICIALAAAALFAAAPAEGGVYETEMADGNGWKTVTDM